MELIRTVVVALFFACVVVGLYYLLYVHNKQTPEAVTVAVAETEATPEKTVVAAPVVAETPASPFQAPAPKTFASAPVEETLPDLAVPEMESIPQDPFANSTQSVPVEALPTSLDSGVSSDPSATITATEPIPTLEDIAGTEPISAPLPAPTESFSPFDATPVPEIASSGTQVGSAATPQIENPLRSGTRVALPEAVPEMVPMMPTLEPIATTEPVAVSVPESAPRSATEEAAVREYLATAEAKIKAGQALEVLRALSPFYGDTRFTSQEMEHLTSILVSAATEVIYLPNSFLEPPYVIQPEDTLVSIAEKYQIPADFLARVNNIPAPYVLEPGRSLKVLRGPFSAYVYLDRYEMILTLDGMFAGRFWIGVGGNLPKKDGDFIYRQMISPPNTVPSPQNVAYEFVKDINQTNNTPDTFVLLHPASDMKAVGHDMPTGNVILSQTDIESLGALLGKNSVLKVRTNSLAGANPASMQGVAPVVESSAVTAPVVAVPATVAVPTTSVPATAVPPAMPSIPEPVMDVPSVHQTIGQQASLPGLESSGGLPSSLDEIPVNEVPVDLGGTGGLPDSLPDSLPATLP